MDHLAGPRTCLGFRYGMWLTEWDSHSPEVRLFYPAVRYQFLDALSRTMNCNLIVNMEPWQTNALEDSVAVTNVGSAKATSCVAIVHLLGSWASGHLPYVFKVSMPISVFRSSQSPSERRTASIEEIESDVFCAFPSLRMTTIT